MEQLDNWTPFLGSMYIKGSDLVEEKARFEVEDIKIVPTEKGMQLVLDIFYTGIPFQFGLNRTNATKLKDLGVKPKDLIGKVLVVRKVLATNPQTRKEVPSIRVDKVENKQNIEEEDVN